MFKNKFLKCFISIFGIVAVLFSISIPIFASDVVPASDLSSISTSSVSGTWLINENPDFSYFGFDSSSSYYNRLYFITGTTPQFSATSFLASFNSNSSSFDGIISGGSNPSSFSGTEVYNSSDGWLNPRFRYLSFNPNTPCSDGFLDWLVSNAEFISDSFLFEEISGTYFLNDDADFSFFSISEDSPYIYYLTSCSYSLDVSESFDFVTLSHDGLDQLDYIGITSFFDLTNSVVQPFTGDIVYEYGSGWIADNYRYIHFDDFINVSVEFYHWLTTNSVCLSETSNPSGTWLISDYPNFIPFGAQYHDSFCYVTSGDALYNFEFICNGVKYYGIAPTPVSSAPLPYTYDGIEVFRVYDGGWTDFTFRTLTFSGTDYVPFVVQAWLFTFATPHNSVPDIPSEETINIFFYNNWSWSDVCIHYWSNTFSTSWPGISMTQVGLYNGFYVYLAIVPANVSGIVFSGIKDDGSGYRDQSPDIVSGIVDGAGWEMAWNGINTVKSFTYTPYLPPDPGDDPSHSGDYLDGYIAGRDDGYLEGYNFGYEKGYAQGRSDALNLKDTQDVFDGFLSEIISSPIKAFDQIIIYNGNDSFGNPVIITLWSIFITIFASVIAFYAIKLFFR